MNFIEIQSWPEIPSIGYFVSLFSSSFDLPDFDIEDLEEALLLDSSENNSIDDSSAAEITPQLIPELIVSLLRGCDSVKSWPNITTSNYQMFLRRLFRHKCEEYAIENPFNSDTDFHSLSLRTKVVILNYLCDFRLDAAEVEFITNQFEPDSLRIEPLGYDSSGSVYWYFYGTRLYREDFPKKSSNRVWQVICFTEQDWETLANKFKGSKSHKEAALHKILVEDFLPNIPVLFRAKEAERRRRLFQRRSSIRVKNLIERQKGKQSSNTEELPDVAEDETENKLSQSEKYLREKKKEFQAKAVNREKKQEARALRAQRRLSSTSSTGFHEDDFNSQYNSSTKSSSTFANKENILNSDSQTENICCDLKMPPISTKLPGRQTNNSLSSITGQIMIDTQPRNSPGPTTVRKRKIKTDEFMETDELQIGMHKVLQHLKNHDDAWPFMDPVEEDIAPRYYSIIKRPMDILKMEEKLENGEYRTLAEFRTDFKLIVNNCRLYNGQNNEYTEMVNNLQQAFERSSKKYFDQTSSDEEPVLLEYPPIEPNTSRVNIEPSKTKVKVKDKKLLKNLSNSTDDTKSDSADAYKFVEKSKETKLNSPDSKSSKKLARLNASEKKKEKSTKGVKRKHKDKEKTEKTKNKKVKQDDAFEQDSFENSENESQEKTSKDTVQKLKKKKSLSASKLVDKKIKKTVKDQQSSPDDKKSIRKDKKFENVSSTPTKNKKKSKKDVQCENEKFSKTNAKANIKKSKKTDLVEFSDSDDDSVHDLIEEKHTTSKVDDSRARKAELKRKLKKKHTPSSTGKHVPNSKKNGDKLSKDLLSMTSESFSRSPSPLPSLNSSVVTDDFNNSFDSGKNSKSLELLRSDTPEIRDKFDLIKERRNKMNQERDVKVSTPHKKSQNSHKTKEKHLKTKVKTEKLKSKHEKSEETNEALVKTAGKKASVKVENSLFDRLKNEDDDHPKKDGKERSKHKGKRDESDKKAEDSPLRVENSKTERKEGETSLSKKKKEGKNLNVDQPQSKNKKQIKACLDVLDMETEQTLKDINKWLEHTPRFEYSSASNSPSRYIIEEIDMPSNDDFRKPIPLMPSSPSASHTNFQAPQSAPKDFNLLKESNNNKQSSSIQQNAGSASTSQKKSSSSRDPKKKSLKEKLQQLPKKKEVQRTIDRLQPGKTKGNLLHNIQNINKPEELFPLGNRDKIKEVKNSLIVQTDESSPKLSLGTVLDTQAFNFTNADNKKSDSERFETNSTEDISEKVSFGEKDSPSANDQLGSKSVDEAKTEPEEVLKDSDNNSSENSKPNLNAWFKAFGVPKKQKKSESHEEQSKSTDSELLKTESNFMPLHQRRLSTGSSLSERSSGSSPQVGLEERLGAAAPFPSPIGASPMSASPKIEDQKIPSNYTMNGSTRVGFYQDMTSKSSPEKSSSPREMPSPYGQFNHQNMFPNPTSGSGIYGSFYNPENASSSSHGQSVSYSKPTSSPASYYDQYKQPMSQESEFNNSMSPSTNPNSPYHSQQSSPYQQQPHSPFQSGAGNSSGTSQTTTNLPQAPNSPYSQPNSPYQQSSQQASTPPFHHQSSSPSSAVQSQPAAQNQTQPFNIQPTDYSQLEPHQTFSQPIDPFGSSRLQPNCAKISEWPKTNTGGSTGTGYDLAQQHNSNTFTIPPHQPSQQNAQNQPDASASIHSGLNPNTNDHFTQAQENYNKKPLNEAQLQVANATNAALYAARKHSEAAEKNYARSTKESAKNDDGAKFLDLSKQQQHAQVNQHATGTNQLNQYQQMFDLAAYSKAPADFDLSKSKNSDAKSLQKNISSANSLSACSAGSGFWSNTGLNKPQEMPQSYGGNHGDISKSDLSTKASINNMQSNPILNNSMSHHTNRNIQSPMDINYKQPIFNNSTASSMMELTAFMRDFRQVEERFSSLSGAAPSFYDKNMTPAHMFGKNLQQTNNSVAIQQMFNNSMTTMAYNREQNMNLASYHSRMNTTQVGPANTSQAHTTLNTPTVETKAKKQRKKKNASPDASMNIQSQNAVQHPQQSLHSAPQMTHQQSFQSYGGLKIPSAPGNSSDPSSIALKSVVPGSAFNYGPTPLTGLYGENPAYLDDFRGSTNPYYPSPGLTHRSTPDPTLEKTTNPPPAHPQTTSSAYHHLLPPHHPSRSSYPFMNTIDPATLQQQYRMMLNQTYQAGYHPALGMHNQPPHWPHM